MVEADPIQRLNAALKGRYRIERELGEGGMATVYLAADLKHDRKVALKVLKPELAAVVGADRFLAEIKTTANLQHPHILGLHDSGEADGLLFYVMPYVEGESLRHRLDREHQLPVDNAVGIATNLAEALDYAHRQGVIHRDIKPANILLQDGKPVISDFGIAFAVSAGGGDRLTETGLSLGTPHYMSPEQATGDLNVGPATDIYALGCVLYEMLVGEPPFTGSTPQAVLGKIITGETPSAREERRTVPPNVDAVIVKALEKVPADRFAGASEFGRGLADPGFTIARTVSSRASSSWWNPLSVGATAVAAIAIMLLLLSESGESPQPLRHLSIPVPGGFEVPGRMAQSVAISPDGSMIAYSDNGALYLRRFADDGGQRIDAEGPPATAPTFSPDGEHLAWRRNTELMRMSVGGGLPTSLGPVPSSQYGMDWGPDDRIYTSFGNQILSVSSEGGDTAVAVELGETLLMWPQSLRGGELLLFTALGPSGKPHDSATMLLEFGSRRIDTLMVGGAQGRYIESGHLLYVTADGNLMARRLDLDARAFDGPAAAVVSGLLVGVWGGGTPFAVSSQGMTLAAVRGDSWSLDRLVWFGRDGSTERYGPPWTGYDFALHPEDPDVVAVSVAGRLNDDVFIWRSGAQPERVSTSPASDDSPMWSPEGTEIVWRIDGRLDRIVRQTFGEASGAAELLFEAEGSVHPYDRSSDGRYLLVRDDFDGEIAILDLEDPTDLRSIPIPSVRAAYPTFSPDGRWIAYTSVEPLEVVVLRSDGSGSPQSVGRGGVPKWDPSGRSLYYLDYSDPAAPLLLEARVQTGAGFRVAGIDTLFAVPEMQGGVYRVGPDGQRFLFKVRNTQVIPQYIDLILGFDQELERLLPN